MIYLLLVLMLLGHMFIQLQLLTTHLVVVLSLLKLTSLPAGGANYRVETVANGNWFQAPASALSEGPNSIETLSGVSFTRSVKIQFSSGDVEFDSFVLNGEDVNTCAVSLPGVAAAISMNGG